MAETRLSVTINRPVAEVFAVLSDPERTPEWSSLAVEETMTSPGPIGVGSTYRAVGKTFGRRVVNHNEVVEFVPNRMWTVRVMSGPMRARSTMTFESVQSGTRIVLVSTLESGGFLLRLIEPVASRLFKRQFGRDLEHLKELMESGNLVALSPDSVRPGAARES